MPRKKKTQTTTLLPTNKSKPVTEMEKLKSSNKELTTSNIQFQFKIGELNGEIKGLKSTIDILLNNFEHKK